MSRAAAARLAALAMLLGGAAILQARLEAVRPPAALSAELYVTSPAMLQRAALSFDALLADIYWMRAIQHFGGTRRSDAAVKRYDLLYPLLDLTTSLDPSFTAPYLFGAIFLAEPQPGGAGRPDLAMKLLEKGLAQEPDSWRYAEQIGFVHYLYRNDPGRAAEWFGRASRMPGALPYLATLEATARAEGGDLATARQIWLRLAETAESSWMRDTARFRLLQVEAYAAIDALEALVAQYAESSGTWPDRWEPLVRAGLIRGVPLDPAGVPFVVSRSGSVTVDPSSPLHPLPVRPRRHVS